MPPKHLFRHQRRLISTAKGEQFSFSACHVAFSARPTDSLHTPQNILIAARPYFGNQNGKKNPIAPRYRDAMGSSAVSRGIRKLCRHKREEMLMENEEHQFLHQIRVGGTMIIDALRTSIRLANLTNDIHDLRSVVKTHGRNDGLLTHVRVHREP